MYGEVRERKDGKENHNEHEGVGLRKKDKTEKNEKGKLERRIK